MMLSDMPFEKTSLDAGNSSLLIESVTRNSLLTGFSAVKMTITRGQSARVHSLGPSETTREGSISMSKEDAN